MKGTDDVQSLKRRVIGLARLDLDVVHLDTGPVLVRGRRIRDARAVVTRLKSGAGLDLGTLVSGLQLEAAPVHLDAHTLAALTRDLRVLDDPRLLALAAEHRRHFARFGEIDEQWLREKEARLVQVRAAIPPASWTDSVVELVNTLRGEDEGIAVRDALAKSREPEKLALLALAFRLGEKLPWLRDVNPHPVLELQRHDVTIAQACRIAILEAKYKKSIAKLVAGGLSLHLVETAERAEILDDVAYVPDARAARAYITWWVRLDAHYTQRGIPFALPSKLFEQLPNNADLAVLTLCLLEQKPTTADPIAALDATLGLFRRLPTEARAILDRLRGAPAGLGRRRDPEFAAWLGDDALLDRVVHLADLAGERPISRQTRADHELLARFGQERAYLAGLSTRTVAQQRRLDSLCRDGRERPVTNTRTLRRLRARIEQLLPIAYQRQLDRTFRHILRDGWHLDVGTLTPAWRDAVRFWLVADNNRDLLEKLLREAAKRPGAPVKDVFPANAAWISKTRLALNVDAWLAPRREPIPGTKLTIHFEDDPLEVLRMGIPFATCLALDGENAASTITNAIDANKRVIYVRNETNSIVARKLVGISPDNRIVGYQLYSSLDGEADDVVRAAMVRFCNQLAADVGAPLASTGTPAEITGGWWYNDGEVPFDPESSTVLDYCQAIGLAPPLDVDAALNHEALAWRARQSGDAVSAARLLIQFGEGTPTAYLLGEFAVSHLELRKAAKLAQGSPMFGHALLRHHAKDESGLLAAIDLAKRLPEWRTRHHLGSLLHAFPPSPKVGAALADLARWSMRRERHEEDPHGAAHFVIEELPAYFEDVVGALDLLDAVAPAWRWHAGRKTCKQHIEECEKETFWAFAQVYARRPAPQAIVVALRSKRRSDLARRAAERVRDEVVETRPDHWLPPDDVVDRWASGDAQVADDLAQQNPYTWGIRVRAIERAAAARGIAIDGFCERVILQIAEGRSPEDVLWTDSLERIEAVFAIVITKVNPKAVGKIFNHLRDALSVAMFRRVLERETRERIAAIGKEIASGVTENSKRRRTFYAWLFA